MDGRERQIDEPKRFRKMSIHVSRNRPGQIKWDFITRPRRETANYTTPQASAKMMQTCWFWDRPNHQIAGFRLTKCQNAAKLGVWRVITSVGVGGVYQTPNRDHTYIIVYTNRYMICIDMSYDIPVYWFIDQCLPLQFPLNRTLRVFRKESANRSVAEEPLNCCVWKQTQAFSSSILDGSTLPAVKSKPGAADAQKKHAWCFCSCMSIRTISWD